MSAETTPQKSTQSHTYSWAWWVLIAFLVVVYIFSGKSLKKDIPVANKNQSTIEGSNSSSEKKYEIENTIRINFTGEYGDIFDKIHPGDLVSFENSSEPYCVKNKVKEYCAQKGEDVGTQIPNSTNNGKLRFKSQNGNTGYVDVIFWKPK